eukprot:1500240-Alexandrium_andersonii.AAC.1
MARVDALYVGYRLSEGREGSLAVPEEAERPPSARCLAPKVQAGSPQSSRARWALFGAPAPPAGPLLLGVSRHLYGRGRDWHCLLYTSDAADDM